VQHDVAQSTQTVAWIMAGIMVVAFVVARFWLPSGRVEDPLAEAARDPDAAPVA
jgi:hypothetical protein